MTKQEIIQRLKQDRATGLTYKWIAAQVNISAEALYDFMHKQRPATRIHALLE